MTDKTDELAAVEQRDRDLFTKLVYGEEFLANPVHMSLLNAGCEDRDERMQAIARHRLSTRPKETPTEQGELAREKVCAHGIRHPWQCDDCDREYPVPEGYDPLTTCSLSDRIGDRLQHNANCRFDKAVYGNLPGETCTCGRDGLLSEIASLSHPVSTNMQVAEAGQVEGNAFDVGFEQGFERAREAAAKVAESKRVRIVNGSDREVVTNITANGIAAAIRALSDQPDSTNEGLAELLREALEPFAAFADARDGMREPDDGGFASTIIHGGTGDPKNGIPCDITRLTIGDLRRARTALQRLNATREPAPSREQELLREALEQCLEQAARLADHFANNAFSEGMSEDVVMARSYFAHDIATAIRTLTFTPMEAAHERP